LPSPLVIRRIGEPSRELEKAERTPTDLHPNDLKQTKSEPLAAVGILPSPGIPFPTVNSSQIF
jgi:hypothetical protein